MSLSANAFAFVTSTPAAVQIFSMNASVAYPEFSWPWLKYQSCVKYDSRFWAPAAAAARAAFSESGPMKVIVRNSIRTLPLRT